MMKHFYYAADWGFGKYAFIDNVLVSAGSMYAKKLSLNRGMIPESTKRLFLDSGGYSFFTRWGKYPFSIEEYVIFAQSIQDEYPLTEVAIMDFPCEPNTNRSILKSNKERIDNTVQNALSCIDYDPNLPWVPVIQGYTLNEYLYCLDLYKDAKMYHDDFHLWAIGTLCARKKLDGIRSMVVNITDKINAPVHTFGMNYRFLKDPQIFFSIYSSDSGAWSYNGRAHEKLGDLIKYDKKIMNLIESFTGQKKLECYNL